MQYLTVVYDQHCGLCERLGEWLLAQPKWIGIRLIPSGQAARLYPVLAPRIAGEELIAVGDDGAVYFGDHAWIMCLYALKHYRRWAKRLSGPALLPMARQAFALLSGNRRRLARWLQLRSDEELAVELRAIQVPRCHATNI